MAEAATAAAKPNLEKRDAILAAALRLIARFGLHNTPMSAVAREAGVAVGTVYLYFPSKEAMINALYLHVLEDRNRSLYSGAPSRRAHARRSARRALGELARARPLAPRARGRLQPDRPVPRLGHPLRRDARLRADAWTPRGSCCTSRPSPKGHLRGMSRYVFWALLAGPVYALVQMRDAGETEITEDVLRATFDGVCRALLPGAVAVIRR